MELNKEYLIAALNVPAGKVFTDYIMGKDEAEAHLNFKKRYSHMDYKILCTLPQEPAKVNGREMHNVKILYKLNDEEETFEYSCEQYMSAATAIRKAIDKLINNYAGNSQLVEKSIIRIDVQHVGAEL